MKTTFDLQLLLKSIDGYTKPDRKRKAHAKGMAGAGAGGAAKKEGSKDAMREEEGGAIEERLASKTLASQMWSFTAWRTPKEKTERYVLGMRSPACHA